ncbi:MAG: DUF2974 domain-containing protein [Deltaproteobacteria bacterium]|nr:DUF2974 domain-containing protein [Deltaproteobacteria bacterium]
MNPEQMAAMFVEGLKSGAIGPTVVDSWDLPGPEPKDDPVARRAWAQRRAAMFSAAPSLIAEYVAALQGAIEDWEVAELGRVLLEAQVFISRIKEYLVPAHERVKAGDVVSDFFALDEGLEPARGMDLALLRENAQDTEALMTSVVSDVLQVARMSWRHGVPQKAAAAAPEPMIEGNEDAFEAHLQEIVEALVERVRNQPKSEVEDDPLDPDLDKKMSRRLAGAGRRRLHHGDIPDEDVFAEFLAHRYAYSPEVPLFAKALRTNGYSKERSHAFETRAGLSFHIVMPSEEEVGSKPPILVFRGTQLDDLNDIRTDLEFQIGQTHFDAVKSLGVGDMLLGAAKDAGGLAPIITGHSLGGALAQLTAATWPARVGGVVTFQAPGLTRAHHRRATEGFARLSKVPPVRHYIADRDIVHQVGQRHLPGETVLVTGIHVDRGEGYTWGLSHTDLLLADHGMRQKVVDLGLAAIWSPHTLSGFTMLPEHPTKKGSGLEMARGGLSLSLRYGKQFLVGPRDPATLVSRARELAAQGLDQETPSLAKASVEVAANVVTSASRAVRIQVKKLGQRGEE